MGITLSVWNELIVLDWDGKMPGHERAEPVLRMNPEKALNYWKHLKGYAVFSKTQRKFFLPLSKQNLWRVYHQFGQVPVRAGQFRIENLKAAIAEMKSLGKRIQAIKDGDLEPIQYKMPPLGEYQHVGANILTRCERVPLFADCGVGKTWMVLVSTQEQFRRGIVSPGKVLICAKLATLETGWMDDCAKFTHMKAALLWTKSNYKKKEKILEILNSNADVFIINHDGLRVFEKELCAKNFEKVVVDESTILKSFKGASKRFKGGRTGQALMAISKNARWRVIMSGTPAPNGPQDLWGQMHFLDPAGVLLEKTINDFNHTFMKEVFFGDPNNPNTPKTWKPGPESHKVGEIVNPFSYRVKIRDHLHDLPSKAIIKRPAYMGGEQLRAYKKMEEELWAEIGDTSVTVDMALTKLIKLRQITGGFIINAAEEAVPVEHNPKLDALDCLLEDEIDHGQKVVIYAQYQYEIELLLNRYKDYGAVTVYGGNKSSDNLANIRSFIENKNVRLCILHPKSAAHGITFVCAHYMIFYSISYSAEDNYQCVRRIERAGQKHPMFVYYLLAEGDGNESIDEIMFDVVADKEDYQESLLNAGKDIFDRWRATTGGKRKGKGKRKKS